MEGAKKYSGLGALPASNATLAMVRTFSPPNMETELITEPFERTNSLRTIEQVSQITGLVEPKLVHIRGRRPSPTSDAETAKEIAMTGADVEYGRFKTKITATVKGHCSTR